MKKRKRTNLLLTLILIAAMLLTGCGSSTAKEEGTKKDTGNTEITETNEPTETQETTEPSETQAQSTKILIAAAASLEYSLKDELIPMFEEQNPGMIVEGTYDSSGKLQTQIEEGIDADIFFSAASKQMDALDEKGMVNSDSRIDLLKNKIVLIVPSDSSAGLSKFEDIAKVDKIAIGDPDSVPAGQYAKEALTALGLWEAVSKKASLGTNVTEVLTWVSEGSADAGIVYATDAATNPDELTVIGEAPSGSLKSEVIYPIAVLKNSTKQEAAKKFVDFLSSKEAIAVFEKYGFTDNIK